MMKKSSSSENEPCCSKDYKKNTETPNKKIIDLSDKLFDSNNMIYYYKLALAQVESRLVEYKEKEVKYYEKIRTLEFHNEDRANCIEILKKKLETLKEEKEGVDGKLACLLKASKDLDNLIESQRSDKIKDGLGYSDVPPLPAQLYLSPKKDLSWTGLPECADDTVTDYSRPSPTVKSTSRDDQNRNSSASENRESTDSILSKPAVKFVKAAERSTTNKVETVKKPSVKYIKMYRTTTKKPNVRGNQRNWNNLKSHQLGPNFVMKKKTCFNCGDFNHLAYDCRKTMKMGTSRSQNKTHERFKSRPVAHRPYRPLVRPKNNIQAQKKKKMMKKSSILVQVESRLVEYKEKEVKYCEKIRTLEFHNEDRANCIKILKKKLKTLKEEKEGVDGKLAGLLKALKDLDNLIESQRSDKIKDGLGYSVVPPPPAQLYLSPKKDLSWTGLLEYADDTVTDYSRPSPTVESTSGEDQNKNSSASENGESTDSILSKPAVKFVKAVERSTTNKVETVKKPFVKYAKMYRTTTKKPNVRGNQRNWNNFKSHQLGQLRDKIRRLSEDKKKQRNKKLEDSEAEHQV
nr:ubiquitin hydrolase [Tanacetum cinerariifolium]